MEAKKILLVEGDDDEHVFKHLCGVRGIGRIDKIIPTGGVEKLLESYSTRLKASEEGTIIGVVLDADTDLASRWQSLRNRLINKGYEHVPESPVPEGTILEPPADGVQSCVLPRVGIWIMPDNQTSGILEDFLLFLVPEGSQLLEHVKSSVENIPEGERYFSKLAEPKAVIHTWLAWQKEPGKPYGTAITARFLDPMVTQADTLVSWLNRLFFQ